MPCHRAADANRHPLPSSRPLPRRVFVRYAGQLSLIYQVLADTQTDIGDFGYN